MENIVKYNLPNRTEKETMNSLQIAEVSGKQHKHVLEAIRSMEPAWEKINGTKFRLVEYIDAKGERRPCYELTKTECLYIATKFNDEARAKLVLRWEKLETQPATHPALPTTFAEALRLAASQAEQIEEQKRQIAADAPRVLFSHAVETSQQSILIAELAKILYQNGIDIGAKRLFRWMREHGYLCRHGDYYNQPTQKAMERGLFEVKKTTISKPSGETIVSTTTKVTGKGQVYFVNKFLKVEESYS